MHLILEPSHIRLIASGKKTQTRTPYERTVKHPRPGDVLGVRPSRNKPSRISIEVTTVYQQQLRDMSYRDATAEGFKTRDEYWNWWYLTNIQKGGSANPETDPETNPADILIKVLPVTVWVITFRVYDEPRLLAIGRRGDDRGYTTQTQHSMWGGGHSGGNATVGQPGEDASKPGPEPEALTDTELTRIQGWRPAVADNRRRTSVADAHQAVQNAVDNLNREVKAIGGHRDIAKSLRSVEHHLKSIGRQIEVEPTADSSDTPSAAEGTG